MTRCRDRNPVKKISELGGTWDFPDIDRNFSMTLMEGMDDTVAFPVWQVLRRMIMPVQEHLRERIEA